MQYHVFLDFSPLFFLSIFWPPMLLHLAVLAHVYSHSLWQCLPALGSPILWSHSLVTSLCWEHNSSGLHNVGSLESLIHMGYPPTPIWEEKAVKLNDEQWRNKIILLCFICPQNCIWRLLCEKFWWCSLQSAVCFSVCCEDDHSCYCTVQKGMGGTHAMCCFLSAVRCEWDKHPILAKAGLALTSKAKRVGPVVKDRYFICQEETEIQDPKHELER